jgi:retron-type reverse transcriptase
MAKSYRDLFPAIRDFSALYAAYGRARRGKRHHPEVLRFERNLEGELFALQDELDAGTYVTGPYHTFTIHEPKPRLIAALPFRDRVLQHSLIATLEPLWEPSFIPHSYACRPGRGLHQGIAQAHAWLQRLMHQNPGRPIYALRTDISSYFASVNHAVLRRQLARRIACPCTLYLCDGILDAWPQGLPIGNLTSQLWANIHLHDLDLFAKHQLRARYYARYMDDCLFLHHDKRQLNAWHAALSAWLGATLHLSLNRKSQVFPIAGTAPTGQGRALDWLGFRLWPTHRRLRRASVIRMRRHLKALARAYHQGLISMDRFRSTVSSFTGHASHADAWRITSQLLNQAPLLAPCRRQGDTSPPV